jgi:predicted transcriptional regulator
MIKARPNLNGNSKKDFEDLAWYLHNATDLLENVLKDINSQVLHGRNYQTSHTPTLDRAEDVIILQRAMRSLDEIKSLEGMILVAALNRKEGE